MKVQILLRRLARETAPVCSSAIQVLLVVAIVVCWSIPCPANALTAVPAGAGVTKPTTAVQSLVAVPLEGFKLLQTGNSSNYKFPKLVGLHNASGTTNVLEFQSVFNDAWGTTWAVLSGQKYKVLSATAERWTLLDSNGTVWEGPKPNSVILYAAVVIGTVGILAYLAYKAYMASQRVASNHNWQLTNGLSSTIPSAPTVSSMAYNDTFPANGATLWVTNQPEDNLVLNVSTNGWKDDQGHPVTTMWVVTLGPSDFWLQDGAVLKNTTLLTSTNLVDWAPETEPQVTLGWMSGEVGEPANSTTVLYMYGRPWRTNWVRYTQTTSRVSTRTDTCISNVPRRPGVPKQFWKMAVSD